MEEAAKIADDLYEGLVRDSYGDVESVKYMKNVEDEIRRRASGKDE
jgi:hypothetical protein